ncbi:MAG: outer membrane beta-barrel protein [Xanthobacteraceae bacterium]
MRRSAAQPFTATRLPHRPKIPYFYVLSLVSLNSPRDIRPNRGSQNDSFSGHADRCHLHHKRIHRDCRKPHGSTATTASNICGANSSAPHACGADMQSFGTLRGRIGYAVGSNGGWLPYVTGGLAVGDIKSWDAFWPASSSDFRAGWTIGGGIETILAANLTFKLEYLYADFGHWQAFDVVPGTPETVNFRTNIFRGGIDYAFH